MAGARWPDHLLQRARRAPGPGLGIVPGSTPVVSYGDPRRASVVTLGLTPSVRQFNDHFGRLLTGGRRRLSTLESLGVPDHAQLTDEHATAILDDCAGYFDRHPYHWFHPLDAILQRSLGASYFDGTACHLDLVQWALLGGWGGLDPPSQRSLLRSDGAVLRSQLAAGDHRVVLVNGRSALRWVQESGLVTWKRTHVLSGVTTAGVYSGRRAGLPFVGWCCNVQSQPGALSHAPRLAEIVASLAPAPTVLV